LGSKNGASSEVLIDKVLGTYYNGSQWGIYTEDVSNMPEGLAFDIIVTPQWGLGIENSILEANLEAFPNPTTDCYSKNRCQYRNDYTF